MGASGWHYVTEFDGNVGASVARLQARVFQEEWADEFESLEALWADEEFMGTQGTHSILDVDPAGLRRIPAARVLHHFGTDSPTAARFEEVVSQADERYADSLLDEFDTSWSGRYLVLHTDGRPTHLGLFGSSGD
ncbi:hypothetical protein ACFVQ4_17205 [Streptomyces laurentii]|uniref:hypothetical protein n=1 Tax=Streptomyces laurentii TaxID=39478 RepID=UPI0036BE34B1